MKPGDTVWVVTARSGRLHFLGRIVVGDVTDQREAARLLRTDDLWKATHHIVAAQGSAQQIVDIEIQSLAGSLRFESPTQRDRLSLVNGAVRAQQLQTMRVLTPESAELLGQAMERAPRRPASGAGRRA